MVRNVLPLEAAIRIECLLLFLVLGELSLLLKLLLLSHVTWIQELLLILYDAGGKHGLVSVCGAVLTTL